jgi:hypothetical protein
MIDPVCSISNIMLSVEKLWWDTVAKPNNELLISKNDYNARIEELKIAKSAIIWDLADMSRTHHWSANLYIGATTFQDFGNKKLYRLTDEIKYIIDTYLYIPVFDYTQEIPEEFEINKLVLVGPVKWLPITIEPNEFKTSIFAVTVKYAQTGYL